MVCYYVALTAAEENNVEKKKRNSSKPAISQRERPRSSQKSRRNEHVTDVPTTSPASNVVNESQV